MNQLSFYLNFLIALIFILAISSNIVAVCFETYAYIIKLRAKYLKSLLEDIFNEALLKKQFNLTELFYQHPQIDFTKKNYRQLPSYISPTNFAQTLIDTLLTKWELKNTSLKSDPVNASTKIISKPYESQTRFSGFEAALADLPESDLKKLLNGFCKAAQGDIEKLQVNLEKWYEEYMNRASGWYKMLVQKRLIVFTSIMAFALNMDFFKISSTLLTDKELTKEISMIAEKYRPDSIYSINPGQATSSISTGDSLIVKKIKENIKIKNEMLQDLYKANAPIGWADWNNMKKENFRKWLIRFLGYIITGLALSYGAPFWFDMLAKLINIRKTGVKP